MNASLEHFVTFYFFIHLNLLIWTSRKNLFAWF